MKVLEWLSADDDHSSGWHGAIVARRAENSGKWFLNKFKAWLQNDSDMLFVCTGKGTSVIVHALTIYSWCRKVIPHVSFLYCYCLTLKGLLPLTTSPSTE